MVSYFPMLYPDELLSSAIARFYCHTLSQPNRTTNLRLYGEMQARTAIAFPNNLLKLHGNIGMYLRMNVRELINKTTLFPFYFAISDAKAREENLRTMLNRPKHGTQISLGYRTVVCSIKLCPDCVRQDTDKYGEPYWHRAHQLEGVHYCWIHASELQVAETRYFDNAYHPLEHLRLGTRSQRYLPPHSERTRQILMEIARRAESYLSQRVTGRETEKRHLHYRELLLKLYPLGKGNLRVDCTQMENDFVNYFGEQLLEFLGVLIIPGTRENWVRNLLRNIIKSQRARTLKHILFNIFLDEVILPRSKTSISAIRSARPISKGPWICQNPAAAHFGKRVLTQRTLPAKLSRTQVCIFTCSCGYSFSAYPDRATSTGEPQRHQMVRYGKEFLEAVQAQYNEGNTLSAIAKNLNIHRELLKKLIKRNLNELTTKIPGTTPPAKRVSSNGAGRPQVNHLKRDIQYSSRIQEIRNEILEAYPLRRASKNQIREQLKVLNSLTPTIPHLYPLTMHALEQFSETREQFRRRVKRHESRR